jgi:methionine biosynthesis protein MetW
MTQALQAVHYPDKILDEMLRVGRQCIITFPNFGHWRCRWYLASKGRMPVSEFLPYTWYNTPNIHVWRWTSSTATGGPASYGLIC